MTVNLYSVILLWVIRPNVMAQNKTLAIFLYQVGDVLLNAILLPFIQFYVTASDKSS